MISNTFSNQIKSYALLSRTEEYALAVKAAAGDVDAREQLVNCNLRFVLRQALKRKSYCNKSITLDGLIQEGVIGLCRAVDKFDPSKGNRLITYAVWWIDATINQYIIKNFALVKMGTTSNGRRLFFKSRDMQNLRNIHDPDARETERNRLAKVHNVKLKDIKSFEKRMSWFEQSMDEPRYAQDSSACVTLHDTVPSYDRLVVEESDLRSKVMEAFHQVDLNPKEFLVISKRFLEDDPMTLQALGDAIGISRERIRQIQVAALGKLRKHFKAEGYSFEQLGMAA